jgi:membrane protein DedA with SNARE-associated domain
MTSVDTLIHFLESLSPLLVCLVVFLIAFVENIFPPSPSDSLIVFGGSLVAIGRVGFVELLLWTTAGSVLGFLAMYQIGKWFGVRILEKGRIKFIPIESVQKVDVWFRKYGYSIIVVNRFLAGTRAVVSLFAGMSRLRLVKTTVLCALSALAWNTILLGGGYYLGSNWQRIGFYLSGYSQIVTIVIVVAALALIAHYVYKKTNGKKAT